jgi:hypothetical protein
MYHHLPTARAEGINDAGDPSGARHLRNEGIVSIHAYLWEEGKRKGREGGTGKRKGRVEEEHTLSFWWRKMLACLSALFMMRSGVRRGGGGKGS